MSEEIKKRQIFGKLKRILLNADGEIYIILTKDEISDRTIEFLKELEKKFKEKDVIVTFTELIRGLSKPRQIEKT